MTLSDPVEIPDHTSSDEGGPGLVVDLRKVNLGLGLPLSRHIVRMSQRFQPVGLLQHSLTG